MGPSGEGCQPSPGSSGLFESGRSGRRDIRQRRKRRSARSGVGVRIGARQHRDLQRRSRQRDDLNCRPAYLPGLTVTRMLAPASAGILLGLIGPRILMTVRRSRGASGVDWWHIDCNFPAEGSTYRRFPLQAQSVSEENGLLKAPPLRACSLHCQTTGVCATLLPNEWERQGTRRSVRSRPFSQRNRAAHRPGTVVW